MEILVGEVGLEPTRFSASDFESELSTIPTLARISFLMGVQWIYVSLVNRP